MIIVMSFLMVAMIAVMLPRASVAANRVAEVLNTEPTIENPEQSTSFDEDKKGLIESNMYHLSILVLMNQS